MKQTIIFFLFLVNTTFIFSQHEMPSSESNGTYFLLEPERGINNKPTSTKLFEFGENNGTKLLAIGACEKCVPAVYTYQKADSERLGIPVFFNAMGLYVFGYDNNSFIIVFVTNKLGEKPWSTFSFANFYSKSKSKTTTISKKEIEKYAIELSKK